MVAFVIREMHQSEADIWGKMRLRLWEDLTEPQNQREIAKANQDPNATTFLALDDNARPIGFAEVSIRDYANGCTEQPVPFLEGIWVDPEFQRSGAGRALINHIAEDMRTRGFRELCSDILETNHLSHQAHEKWGFEETERVIYFRKSLD